MLDRLTAVRDMALRAEHRARVPDNAMFAALAQELDAIIASGGMMLDAAEMRLVREAADKRIDRSKQKIKHFMQNPAKIAKQPGVLPGEDDRISQLSALIDRIDKATR